MTHQSKCPPPSPPSSSSSYHPPLPATFAECPMTHPLNRAPPTPDFPLTLLHFLQRIIRVISVPTSPLCILTSPLSFHLPFAPKHLSANSTCCAKGNRLFFSSLFLLKNLSLSLFFATHFSLSRSFFSPSPHNPLQLSCLLLETDKKNISRYKSIDGITL